MSDELKVRPADLNQLANQQRDVAAGVEAAEHATDGATEQVLLTHGIVCSLTAAALGAAEWSRSTAAQAVQSVSNDLAGKLDSAADRYTRTDQQERGKLSEQMRPG